MTRPENTFFFNPGVPCRLHEVIFPVVKASIFVLHEQSYCFKDNNFI